MDARRDNAKKVAKFKTSKELREYSHKTKKFYPLDEAKGETIEVLLRRLKTVRV